MNSKSIDGFSLALSLITIGFFMIFFEPLNSVLGLNLSYYLGLIVLFIGVVGLLVEISQVVNKDSGGTDIGVSVFLSIVIYISWKLLDYLNWLNNITVILLLFLGLLLTYGFYRGIAKVISYVFTNSKNKKELTNITLRIIPLLITIALLILRYI